LSQKLFIIFLCIQFSILKIKTKNKCISSTGCIKFNNKMHFSTRQVAAGKTNKIAFPADKKRMAKDSEGYRYFHSLDGKIFPNYLTVEVEIGI